mmetsp:Transcript_143814/g.460386  ORF Transcript_143814/g.460386 Transcript_143814/m.460386 type:complete len:219 (+) Transcript_143814:494-1150(+)
MAGAVRQTRGQQQASAREPRSLGGGVCPCGTALAAARCFGGGRHADGADGAAGAGAGLGGRSGGTGAGAGRRRRGEGRRGRQGTCDGSGRLLAEILEAALVGWRCHPHPCRQRGSDHRLGRAGGGGGHLAGGADGGVSAGGRRRGRRVHQLEDDLRPVRHGLQRLHHQDRAHQGRPRRRGPRGLLRIAQGNPAGGRFQNGLRDVFPRRRPQRRSADLL